MPIEMLRELAAGSLPAQVTEQRAIDLIRVLRSAEMVRAEISAVGTPPEATVHEVTDVGFAALSLAQHETSDESPGTMKSLLRMPRERASSMLLGSPQH